MTESFKKLLEKYQAGLTTDEENKQVEEKLAEFSLLQDMYFEKEDVRDFPTDEIDSKKLKKNYNRKFFNLGLKVFLSILLVVGLGFFIGRPILEKFYYDPTITSEESVLSEHQIMRDIQVQLTNPIRSIASTSIEKVGFASYQVKNRFGLTFSKRDSWKDPELETYQFKRGHVIAYENDHYYSIIPALRYMEHEDLDTQRMQERSEIAMKEKVLTAAKEMPQQSTNLFSVASFKKSMTMEEINQLFDSIEDQQIQKKYFAVEVDQPIAENSRMPQFGFYSLFNSSMGIENRDYNMELNETYPELFPSAFLYTRGEVDYEQHFQSMLQYSIDHFEDQVEHQPSRYGKSIFEEAKNYVENNGLKIHAVYFISTPKDLIELTEKPEVYNMEILDMELYVSR